MKKYCVFLVFLFMIFTTSCARITKGRYQAEFLTLFDTFTTIVGYADDKAKFKNLAEQIYAELEQYHQLYDIYQDYEGVNNIKTINDHAGQFPITVDARILSMLKFAKQQYSATDGAVNVAMGAVLGLWHDYRQAGLENPEKAALPPREMLLEAAQHMDMDNLILNEEASTVYLADPAMRLDVGAIAKGYAVEQVALHLEESGVRSLLLSVGGNVRAIGEKMQTDAKGSKLWTVSVQNPDKSSAKTELLQLQIKGLSVVSSGIYERYYTVSGRQYHHVIDPVTLMPASHYAQVTIVCPDSGLADALSTAVFCMPLEQGRKYVELLDQVEALWVMKDGGMISSRGFMQHNKSAEDLTAFAGR